MADAARREAGVLTGGAGLKAQLEAALKRALVRASDCDAGGSAAQAVQAALEGVLREIQGLKQGAESWRRMVTELPLGAAYVTRAALALESSCQLLATLKDGRCLISSEMGKLQIFDPSCPERRLVTLIDDNWCSVRAVDALPDGRVVAVTVFPQHSSELRILEEVKDGVWKQRCQWSDCGHVSAMVQAPGDTLWLVSDRGLGKLSLSGGPNSPVAWFGDGYGARTCIEVLPDGRIVTGSALGIELWSFQGTGAFEKHIVGYMFRTDCDELSQILGVRALIDGSVVAFDILGSLRVFRFERGAGEAWFPEVIHDPSLSRVVAVQAHIDGGFVSVHRNGDVRHWTRLTSRHAQRWKSRIVLDRSALARLDEFCPAEVRPFAFSAGEVGIGGGVVVAGGKGRSHALFVLGAEGAEGP